MNHHKWVMMGFPMDGTLIQTHSLLSHIIHYSWDCILGLLTKSYNPLFMSLHFWLSPLFHACKAISCADPWLILVDTMASLDIISSLLQAFFFGSLCVQQQHEQKKLIGLCMFVAFFLFLFSFFFFFLSFSPAWILPILIFSWLIF